VSDSLQRLAVYLRRAEETGDGGAPIRLDLSRVSREALEELALAAIAFDDGPGFPSGYVALALARVHTEREEARD
jgi:hypothetical protein